MSTDERPAEPESPSNALRIALALVAVVAFAYSILVLVRPLLGVAVVVLLFGAYLMLQFLYLASRFVHAVERIADAFDSGDREP